MNINTYTKKKNSISNSNMSKTKKMMLGNLKAKYFTLVRSYFH